MSNVQIPNLTAAISITGTEELEAVQGGSSVRVTSAQIASLASPYLGSPLSVGLGGTGLSGGTSGGVLYFDSASTIASSAAWAFGALVIGGGAGGAPATTTTGTGVVTALGVNVGSAGSVVVNGGALGTPGSGVLTNCTGLPISTGVTGLGTGVETFLATPSSANLAAAVTGETGSGALVFGTSPTLTSPTFVTPALGTPSSGNLVNCTGVTVAVGSITGMGTGVATFLATPSSANLASAVTDETGSGALVFASSPTLVTPLLGTPTSGTLTNCTGLPVSTGLSGAGSGVTTALGVNIGSAGSFVVNGGALGTPSSGTLTNATGLPISTGVSGLGANVAAFLATPSSANLASAITDETGSGALVFGTSPTISTPSVTGLSLAAGTVSVAPETFTAGTNLTTPAAGAREYDGDVFYSTVNANNRGVAPSVLFVALSSTRTFTNNSSAQAIFAGGGGPASGQITLPTGTFYFKTCCQVASLSASSHNLTFSFGGTATISSVHGIVGVNPATINDALTSTSYTLQSGSTTTTCYFQIEGIFRVSVAGTVIPQLTQATNTAAATVAAESFFMLNSLGSSSVAYVGNWS